MSQAPLVLTISGVDRPGLVESLAQTVAAHGGNWEQSRMAQLAGRFVGLLEVRVPDDRADDLTAALRALPGLEVLVHRGTEASAPAAGFHMELIGSDQPGIVEKISRALAASIINIEELETGTEPAPDTGMPLFRANLRLSGGSPAERERLRAAMESIAADLMVDIRLDD